MRRLSIRDPRRLAKWLVFGVAAAIALYVVVAIAILAGTFIHLRAHANDHGGRQRDDREESSAWFQRRGNRRLPGFAAD